VLSSLCRPTGKGNLIWSPNSVRNILKNERYCGDIIAQKTYTKDYIDHATGKNRGEKPRYYDSGHHEGIVTQEEYIQALLLLLSNKNAQGINADYKLTVIREGLLAGFIPVNRAFGGYCAPHFIQAVLNAQEEEEYFEPQKIQIINLPGFQVARIQDFEHSQKAAVSVSIRSMTFNKKCVAKLSGSEYAEILLHPTEKLLAVRTSNRNNMNAIRWSKIEGNTLQSAKISCTAFSSVLYELMGWRKKWRLELMGVCLTKNDESVLLFDLRDTEYRMFLEDTEPISVDKGQKKRRKAITLHPAVWRNNFGSSIPEHAIVCRWHKAMLFDSWQVGALGLPVKGFEHNRNISSIADIQQQINELKIIEA
jgi:hypothetical protein